MLGASSAVVIGGTASPASAQEPTAFVECVLLGGEYGRISVSDFPPNETLSALVVAFGTERSLVFNLMLPTDSTG